MADDDATVVLLCLSVCCSCRKLKEFSVCDVDCVTDRSVLALVSCGSGIVSVKQHTDKTDDAFLGVTGFEAAGACHARHSHMLTPPHVVPPSTVVTGA